MGAITILLLPIYPIVYLFFTLATMFGTATGADITEVALPYDESQGIVWTCERTDYGWFDLKDTKIEDDEQIFVFKGRNMFNCESDRRFSKIIFTDKNGNELIYYAKEAVPFIVGVVEVKCMHPVNTLLQNILPKRKPKPKMHIGVCPVQKVTVSKKLKQKECRPSDTYALTAKKLL